jgi:beta-phosphoglucomutase
VTTALQAIIFDFDGVIADSEPLHLRAFQRTLEEVGHLLTAADYYAHYLGYDDIGLIQALARDRQVAMSDGQIAALVARKGAILQEMLGDGHVLFPGAANFIREAARRVPCAIASGAMRHEIVEILQGADLRELCPVIVASGDTPHSKPSPAPYRLAFERLNDRSGPLEPWRCVAIEDSKWGLESARGAGLRCVGVTTSYSAAQLGDVELVVSGLKDLSLDALDALCATQGPISGRANA